MKKGISISLTGIKKSIGGFFRRFHFIIFFVISVGGLAICIFLLNGVIAMTDQANGYTSTASDTGFDAATIERLRKLREPGQDTDRLDLSGRINPFSE